MFINRRWSPLFFNSEAWPECKFVQIYNYAIRIIAKKFKKTVIRNERRSFFQKYSKNCNLKIYNYYYFKYTQRIHHFSNEYLFFSDFTQRYLNVLLWCTTQKSYYK